jgi:large subunit ribosomal protein L30
LIGKLANQPISNHLIKIMAKLRIKLVKSGIDRSERQKRTLAALGLRKLHNSVEHEATPQIKGMLTKVQHLVEITEV